MKLTRKFCWSKNVFLQRPGQGRTQNVTMVPGKGIGPELTGAVEKVFNTLHVPIVFDKINDFDINNEQHLQMLKKNHQILLGIYHDQLQGRLSFQKELDLYAQVLFAKSINTPAYQSRHKDVDIAVFREITEGEYSGIEHEVYPGVIESLKVTTKVASLRVAEYAFEFAFLSGRQKVTAVHKANIMKICDGLFLEACREVAAKYPTIKYEEMIIDNCTMQLVKTPQQFDVMVMPNLYGSIVNNTCSGITSGVGMTPGFDIGENYQCFRQGNKHLGLDIAGQDKANPTATLLSSVMMLRMQNLPKFADVIEFGLKNTLEESQYLPSDLGGNCGTQKFVDQVINHALKYKE